MAIGARGHLGIKKETTWGQKVAGDNDFFLPFVSESLTANIEELLSAAQRGILDEPKSYQGEKAFAGDVVVEVHPTSIGHLLRSALGAPAAATPVGTAATAKQHIFTPMQTSAQEFHADCPLFPYTLEVYRDQGQAFQFLGAVVNNLALNFSVTDKILKATCGIIAKDLSSVDATGLSLEATNPFVWENAVIKIGESQNNNLESFGLGWENHCVAKYFLNNSPLAGKIIRDGFRTIPVKFTIDFTDRVEYDYFIAGTERAFQIKFTGASCETGYYYTLQIDLPLVRYLTFPINIGGPGRITCAVTGKAKYHADGYPMKVTLINLKDTAEYAA